VGLGPSLYRDPDPASHDHRPSLDPSGAGPKLLPRGCLQEGSLQAPLTNV
jgi:hypothetical protein